MTDFTDDEKRQTHWFKPGRSGNPKGWPKGSRNKLGEAFIHDMYEAWQAHGLDAIDRVIEEKPEIFLKVVASLLPREVALVRPEENMTEEQMDAALDVINEIVEQRGLAGLAKPTHGGKGTA